MFPPSSSRYLFQCGDIIEVFSMNQVGIGQGRCRGQPGYFKMCLVEVLPDAYASKEAPRTKQRHLKSTGAGVVARSNNAQSSVEELLIRIGLKEYVSVFILNGYEDLELFRELEPSDLDYLGILNVDHRGKILTAVQLLHDMDCKFFFLNHEIGKLINSSLIFSPFSLSLRLRGRWIQFRER